MKRVLLLHPAHWEQAMGGAELQLCYLADHLLKNKYEIHFIFEDKKNKRIENCEGLVLHPLRRIKLRKRFGQRWFLYGCRVNDILKSVKPDVIYTRFYSSWNGVAAKYAKKNNAKHIWAIASDNDVKQRKIKSMILHPFDFIERQYVNYAFKYATHLVTQTDIQKVEILRQYGRISIHVPKSCVISDKRKLKKDFTRINVIWIANLKSIKHPEYFVELSRQCASNSNIYFKMVGRISDGYKELIDLAYRFNHNFSFLGELSNDDVQKELEESHILVNTSDYEALPNTFIEAWSNKVIILSRTVNPDNIITNHKIGFICPSIEEMLSTLLLLHLNRDLLKNMGERAYDYVVSNHSFEKSMGLVMSLIDSHE
ncbi:MAG: glycosyltransferase family 4 protein [Bacteroidales bacterium]|nr:glycosyltransferase family 4 protein [Bacteroidales bacterium]